MISNILQLIGSIAVLFGLGCLYYGTMDTAIYTTLVAIYCAIEGRD